MVDLSFDLPERDLAGTGGKIERASQGRREPSTLEDSR